MLDERKKTLDKMEESGRTNENKREAQRKKKRKKWRSLEEGEKQRCGGVWKVHACGGEIITHTYLTKPLLTNEF